MITFDEVGKMLDDIADEMPAELFRELNGGVNLLPDIRLHPESRETDKLYILGQYHYDPNGLGRYITIHYGSFIEMYAHLPPAALIEKLRETFFHEFTHHLESLAGERDLEIKDAQDLMKYRKRRKE